MMKYLYILPLLILNTIVADESIQNRVYYFQSGPNLVSFDVLPNDSTVDNIFSNVQDNIIAIISSGEIGYNTNDNWAGNLTELNGNDGYWVITSDVTLINLEGIDNESEGYYLNSGANLISYPFNSVQTLEQALPFYIYNNLSAIIGEDEAALIYNNQIFGSLNQFEPNKGYWFLTNNAIPFEYNSPILENVFQNSDNLYEEEPIEIYNQSSLQSVFFIDKAFYNGLEINFDDNLIIKCNDTIVGNKKWLGQMTDIIAMGNDGYGSTDNYCEDLQNISISLNKNNSYINMNIIGNTIWENNNISIISLSDFGLGDVNLDDNINITDIIIIIDHIINNNQIINPQGLFLSDVNHDENINVTDVIFILDLIIE
tara:strand:+ start:188 stop:1300 length:1113 start_codon:yes stop_codon:yes gene_type:complete